MSTLDNNQIRHLDFEPNSLKAVFKKYLPYLPAIILTSIIALGLAAFNIITSEKKFEITASIMIRDQMKGAYESKMLEAIDVFGNSKIVENEVEVLRSRLLMSQVVKNLGLYAQVYRKGRLREEALYANAPIRISVKDPEKIETTELISFRFLPLERLVEIDGKKYGLNRWHKTKWGELVFTGNPAYSAEEGKVEYSFVLFNINDIVGWVLGDLKVSTLNRLTSVVSLSYRDTDAKRGIDILNELMKLYGKSEVDEKNVLARDILHSVEERLGFMTGQLDSVESAIQQFRSTAGVIDISEQGKQYLESVGQYDRQLQDVNIKLSVLDEVEKYIQSKQSNFGLDPAALGVDDPGIRDMLRQMNETRMEYEKLKRTTGENSPLLVPIKEQLESYRPAILDMVQNQRTKLLISRSNLSNTGERYSSILSTFPRKEKKLLEISRQQSIQNQLYSYLLQRREEAVLSFAAAKPDSKIVDYAAVSGPARSGNSLLKLLGAGFIGFLVPLVLINLRDKFNTKVLFRSEIEELTDIPVIAEFFQYRASDLAKYSWFDDNAPYVEQFRALRNRLIFSNDTNPDNRIILVTSSVKGEGKGFIALGLANSLSMAGKRVLLLDLDMKAHGVTSGLDLSNSKGVIDYLKGEASYSSLIIRQARNPMVFVIPTGMNVDGSLDILTGGKLENLLQELKKEFDYVVISGGAMANNSNVTAISKFCNITLYLVRHAVTPKSGVILPVKESKLNTLHNPAIVFNGIKGRGFLKSAYGFGLGYGYEIKSSGK